MKKPPKTPKPAGSAKTTSTVEDTTNETPEEMYEGQNETLKQIQILKDEQALNQARVRGESTKYVADLLVTGKNLVSSFAKRLRHTAKKNRPALRKKLFLAFFELGWSQADICRQFKFRTNMVSEYKRNDEQFEAAVDSRKKTGQNIAEGVIWRAAMLAGFDPRYQDSLKQLLKKLDPTSWRDQQDLRVTTDMGILADTLPLEELVRQISIVKIDITGMVPPEDRPRLDPNSNRAQLPGRKPSA